jgi:hypothetical protein
LELDRLHGRSSDSRELLSDVLAPFFGVDLLPVEAAGMALLQQLPLGIGQSPAAFRAADIQA